MPNWHYIRKLDLSGEPYVNADNLADWVSDLNWEDPAALAAADYIARELRLMGLADAE